MLFAQPKINPAIIALLLLISQIPPATATGNLAALPTNVNFSSTHQTALIGGAGDAAAEGGSAGSILVGGSGNGGRGGNSGVGGGAGGKGGNVRVVTHVCFQNYDTKIVVDTDDDVD